MKLRIIITSLLLGFILPNFISAQLSDKALSEIAQRHADKWASYLNLSQSRASKLESLFKMHEIKKNNIIYSTSNIKGILDLENKKFFNKLSEILTPNELIIYKVFLDSNFKDDKSYLSNLVGAITSDSLFIASFAELHYSEILPPMMSYRMELENVLNNQDKRIIDSIRTEVLGMYDDCLFSCIQHAHDPEHEHRHDKQFVNFDDLLIIAINKDLSNDKSALNLLVDKTLEYEEDIHHIYINHQNKFAYWDKKKDQLKRDHIQPNYLKKLEELQKRNDILTLKHLESDAIFLLIDPYDISKSRKIIHLGLHNEL